jgi:hypothetical protein
MHQSTGLLRGPGNLSYAGTGAGGIFSRDQRQTPRLRQFPDDRGARRRWDIELPLLASRCASLPDGAGPRNKIAPTKTVACGIPRIACQQEVRQFESGLLRRLADEPGTGAFAGQPVSKTAAVEINARFDLSGRRERPCGDGLAGQPRYRKQCALYVSVGAEILNSL